VEAGGPEDSYEALPFKTLALLRRALAEPDWEFLFKGDDDTWVFPDLMGDLLAEYDAEEPLYAGGHPFAWRDGNEQLGAPFTMFVGGPGYVLTRSALARAWPQLEAELSRLGLEDAQVGAAMWRAGVEPTDLPVRTAHVKEPEREFENAVTTLHYMEPRHMRRLFRRVQTRRPAPFRVIAGRTGWGWPALDGGLGYEDRRLVVNGRRTTNALSAHASSAVLLGAAPGAVLRLQGVLADSASPAAQATFEVRSYEGALLADAGRAARGAPAEPVRVRVPDDGRLRLSIQADDPRGCHSAGLWEALDG
jgi:hypothetical protein